MIQVYQTQSAPVGATPSGKGCEVDITNNNMTMNTDMSISSQGSTIVDALQENKEMVTSIVDDVVNRVINTEVAKPKRFKPTAKALHNMEYLYVEAPRGEESVGGISYPQSLSEEFYRQLPEFYTELPMEQQSVPELRDAVLQALITVASAAMPHCKVRDGHKEFSCNIMSLFAGSSTMGKSTITHAGESLETIHKRLLTEKSQARREYAEKVEEYEATKRKSAKVKSGSLFPTERPEEPFTPVIRLAPSTTTPDLIMRLYKQRGMPASMIQAEMINTLNANKGEHGGFLDVTLNTADNTALHRSIKTNEEEFYVEHPVLSFVATMTDDQLPTFFNAAPTGLEARINLRVLYCENDYRPEDDETYVKHRQMMERMQQNLYDQYFYLRSKDGAEREYTLVLTPEVKEQMDRYFDVKSRLVVAKYRCQNAQGVVYRRRVDFKRYLMQLTMQRLREQATSWEEALTSYEITPTMEDADLMLYYVDHLIDHSLFVLERYGKKVMAEKEAKKEDLMELLRSLPDNFTSADAKRKMSEVGMGERESFRAIKAWEKAGFIEQTGKFSRERVFRKLTDRERRKLNNLSVKQSGKCKLSVNKRNKK